MNLLQQLFRAVVLCDGLPADSMLMLGRQEMRDGTLMQHAVGYQDGKLTEGWVPVVVRQVA